MFLGWLKHCWAIRYTRIFTTLNRYVDKVAGSYRYGWKPTRIFSTSWAGTNSASASASESWDLRRSRGDDAYSLRVASRYFINLDSASSSAGFRCVRGL
jgi:hypothetical protein